MTKQVRGRKPQKRLGIRSGAKIALLCGVIACLFVVYRIAMVAYPVTVLGQSSLGQKNNIPTVCAGDKGYGLPDPQLALSARYQDAIDRQPKLTPNLAVNPKVVDIDSESGQPIGYAQSTETDTNSYKVSQDPQNNRNFLHVNDTTKKTSADWAAPSWLMDPIKVTVSGATYGYGFEYRGDTPLEVTIEYSQRDNPTKGYTGVVKLSPTSAWQSFTAHLTDPGTYTDFRVIVTGTEPGYVDTADFDVRRIPSAQLQAGLVTIAFDDGWQSVNSHAVDLLDKYGLRTTQYVISDVADDNTTEYMDYNTIRKLKKSGHEIGSHSLRHCNQTLLDENGVKDNALLSKQVLEQQQLGPVQTFAYPLGQYDGKTQRIFPAHYSYVRTSDQGYNDKYFDSTNIHSMAVLDTTTDTEFKSWLEYAAAHKLWVVIVYHRVDESGTYSVTRKTLDRQLHMIKHSGMNVLPLSEAASRTKS